MQGKNKYFRRYFAHDLPAWKTAELSGVSRPTISIPIPICALHKLDSFVKIRVPQGILAHARRIIPARQAAP